MFKTKGFSLLLVVLLLVVPIFVAACGSDDDQDEGGSNTSGELTQTIEGSGLTVKYPEGWDAQVLAEGSVVVLANNKDILNRADAEAEGPKAGELAVTIMTTPLSGMSARELFVSTAEGAEEIEEIKVGDKDGYKATIDTNENVDSLVVGFEADGVLVVVIGGAATGEIDKFEETMMDIAANIEYSASATE